MFIIFVVKPVEVAVFVNKALVPVKYKPLPAPVTVMLLVNAPV